MRVKLEVEMLAQAYNWESFEAQRFQIASTIIKCFRASTDHDPELLKYIIMAYVVRTSDIIKLILRGRNEAGILVPTKVKKSYSSLTSPFHTT